MHARAASADRHFSMRLLGLSTTRRVAAAGRTSLAVGQRQATARRPLDRRPISEKCARPSGESTLPRANNACHSRGLAKFNNDGDEVPAKPVTKVYCNMQKFRRHHRCHALAVVEFHGEEVPTEKLRN